MMVQKEIDFLKSQTELTQAPMADYRKPTSSFRSSNRLFTNFIPKSFNDSESIMSPTSILDFKPKNTPNQESRSLWASRGPSLGLIEALTDDPTGPNLTKPGSRTVLFGPQLKIQVPPPVFSLSESPISPSDFGIKTMQSHLGPKPSFGSVSSGRLSASEMELSEDYTCVISYGPNPKTTHIFDDCIVESCCGVVKFSESRKDDVFINPSMDTYYPSDGFLSCCCRCKKSLEQGCDIYMYRGEKAFCSVECRSNEMEEEEWMEISDSNEV